MLIIIGAVTLSVVLLVILLVVLAILGYFNQFKNDFNNLTNLTLDSLATTEANTKLINEHISTVEQKLFEEIDLEIKEEKNQEKMVLDNPKKGSKFETVIDCYIVDIFYDEDSKYAIVVPHISDKHINIPSIIKINDDRSIAFGDDDEVTEDIKRKALVIYSEFYKNNRKDFVE